jgi:hypothetical protein
LSKLAVNGLRIGIDMTRSAITLSALFVLTSASFSPCLLAQENRLSFSGAIIQPTCSNDDAVAMASSPRLTCGGGNTVADSGRSYALAIVSLDVASTGHDPLLDYFAGYVNTAGIDGAAAKLAVRTYE